MSGKNGRRLLWESPLVPDEFDAQAEAVILAGDASETLKTLPDRLAKLIITSPPYNLGKAYEQATRLDDFRWTPFFGQKSALP